MGGWFYTCPCCRARGRKAAICVAPNRVCDGCLAYGHMTRQWTPHRTIGYAPKYSSAPQPGTSALQQPQLEPTVTRRGHAMPGESELLRQQLKDMRLVGFDVLGKERDAHRAAARDEVWSFFEEPRPRAVLQRHDWRERL